METKLFYELGEITPDDMNKVGLKAANLAKIKKLGFKVPDAFVISTEFCSSFKSCKENMKEHAVELIIKSLEKLEEKTGKKFGSLSNPLFLSVRGSSVASMPGMLTSILNIGINDEIAEWLSNHADDKFFAYDLYKRFMENYMIFVEKIDKSEVQTLIKELKQKKNKTQESEFSVNDIKWLIKKYKEIFKKERKIDFPQDVKVQLVNCITTVLESWNSSHSIFYRLTNDMTNQVGTGVIVQEMVYGNLNDNSASGVVYSRNPITGANEIYGEYLHKAQCYEIIAGFKQANNLQEIEGENPEFYEQINKAVKKLEDTFKDMQYAEFTFQDGELYILQSWSGMRTAQAAIKIAVDLVVNDKITKKDAVMMIVAKQLDSILHPQFDVEVLNKITPLTMGIAASPGAVSGKIAFCMKKSLQINAEKENAEKENVILIKEEALPEDIIDFGSINGLITRRGGMITHAAVLSRSLGVSYIAGCQNLEIDLENRSVKIGEEVFNEGDFISIDGYTGKVYGQELKSNLTSLPDEYYTFMSWVDDFRVMQVKANVETAREAQIAYNFGAEGIGLVRTEYMFFERERLKSLIDMLLSTDKEQRLRALMKIMPYQKEELYNIFRQMRGYPVKVRLLDPPLHEVLTKTDQEIRDLARELVVSENTLSKTINSLKEFNPMMGHRGLRLNITYPEIAQMQTQAIIEAVIEVNKQFGYNMVVEILIPLSVDGKEYSYVHDVIKEQAEQIIKENQIELNYKIGAMIELPRTCLIADEIALKAEFFSFGTNDLTQMTYGLSRDDSYNFLEEYYLKKILEFDPFTTIDVKGVGKLITMATQSAREVAPGLKFGVCGEHGGDPVSIDFFHNAYFNYVSCSPNRVPIARLSAAQANIRNPRECKLF